MRPPSGAKKTQQQKLENVLTLLSTRLLNLRRRSISHQPIPGLKLLHDLMAVVDQCEPRALSTTILRPEPKARDLVFVSFVELRKLLAQFVFSHVGAVWVEDVTVSGESQQALA